MRRFRTIALAAALVAAAPPAGSEQAAQFDRYDPLSSNNELARRLLPPLAVALAQRDMAAKGQRLAEQPIDLAREEFRIFVPTTMPAAGYGLLVFVPPWPQAAIPPAWKTALAKRGVIMVTMARAGNEEPVLGRREPLAILAATNVMTRFQVDSSRIYVGGFSGGSKVAFKLAVGYPDLFKGAFLLAGADALGDPGFAPPELPLFVQLATFSRIVYITGARDDVNVDLARSSAASLRRFCGKASAVLQVPGLGHELIDQSWFGRVLDLLDKTGNAARPEGESCIKALLAKVGTELDAAEALLSQGRRDDGRKKLLDIDARYGGLALPRSLALLGRLADN